MAECCPFACGGHGTCIACTCDCELWRFEEDGCSSTRADAPSCRFSSLDVEATYYYAASSIVVCLSVALIVGAVFALRRLRRQHGALRLAHVPTVVFVCLVVCAVCKVFFNTADPFLAEGRVPRLLAVGVELAGDTALMCAFALLYLRYYRAFHGDLTAQGSGTWLWVYERGVLITLGTTMTFFSVYFGVTGETDVLVMALVFILVTLVVLKLKIFFSLRKAAMEFQGDYSQLLGRMRHITVSSVVVLVLQLVNMFVFCMSVDNGCASTNISCMFLWDTIMLMWGFAVAWDLSPLRAPLRVGTLRCTSGVRPRAIAHRGKAWRVREQAQTTCTDEPLPHHTVANASDSGGELLVHRRPPLEGDLTAGAIVPQAPPSALGHPAAQGHDDMESLPGQPGVD